ncbi:MAG: FGGY-family carbohydrate kinase [Clostridiales bacterium]|nr:FGGY-family carbohydrate kinase [Clostridiales bacterium]
MKKQYLLGMDLGTTNIKGVLMSIDGQIQKTVSETMLYINGQDSTVEYNAEDFYKKVAGVIKDLTKLIDNSRDICGISIVSASGNTVLLNEGNKPIRSAINWMDSRFTNETEIVLQSPDMQKLYDTIGWPFFNSFPLAHLSWLKINEPENLKSAKRICLITDYVNYRMTEEFKTNPSTATTSYLLDQKAGIWANHIIDKLGISSKMLPEIVKSGNVIGVIKDEAAELTGLLPGTPVVAGSFDHPGAARGTGVLNEGDLLLSCGTSWVGFYPLKDRAKLVSMEMLIDPFLSDSGCYGGMFSLPSIGKYIDVMINKWISNKENKYKLFNSEARTAKSSHSELLINPLTDSHKDFSQYSTGIISRAIMEGTALLMKEQIDNLTKNGIIVNRIVMAGGPTESEVWVKILCDILETDIQVNYGGFAGAVGAAVIAGIGTGIYIDEYDAQNKRRG